MRDAVDAADAAEDARIEAFARLVRADVELDRRTRKLELQLLSAVNRDRSAPAYRACFPRGLSDHIAARGEEQERANRSLVAALGERLPELATEHGAALTSLAEAATTAERA